MNNEPKFIAKALTGSNTAMIYLIGETEDSTGFAVRWEGKPSDDDVKKVDAMICELQGCNFGDQISVQVGMTTLAEIRQTYEAMQKPSN